MSGKTLASFRQLYRLNPPKFGSYAKLRPDWAGNSDGSTTIPSSTGSTFVPFHHRQPAGISHGATGRVLPVSR